MILRLAAVAAVFLVPAAASAYERTIIPNAPDSCLYWESRLIAWSPAEPLGGSLPEAEILQAVRTSFETWSAESCSDLAFTERSATGRSIGYSTRGGNANVVLFRDRSCGDIVSSEDSCWEQGSCADEYDCWEYDSRLIAVTTTTFSQCSGRIVDADIEFNGGDYDFTTATGPLCSRAGDTGCVSTDIRNTLVHEIGHVIGLDHTSDSEATMFASAELGETKKRDLGQDDREALCDIYPAGEATLICEPARPLERCGEGESGSGIDDGGGCSSSGGAGLGFAGFVAALGLLRRRQVRG